MNINRYQSYVYKNLYLYLYFCKQSSITAITVQDKTIFLGSTDGHLIEVFCEIDRTFVIVSLEIYFRIYNHKIPTLSTRGCPGIKNKKEI